MDSRDREELRMVIAVALACVPRAVRKAFAERALPQADNARRQLSEAVTAAVVQAFTVEPKPLPPPGRGVPSRPD